MPRTLRFCAASRAFSSSLTSRNWTSRRPAKSERRPSRIGVIALQGAHVVDPTSTRRGSFARAVAEAWAPAVGVQEDCPAPVGPQSAGAPAPGFARPLPQPDAMATRIAAAVQDGMARFVLICLAPEGDEGVARANRKPSFSTDKTRRQQGARPVDLGRALA